MGIDWSGYHDIHRYLHRSVVQARIPVPEHDELIGLLDHWERYLLAHQENPEITWTEVREAVKGEEGRAKFPSIIEIMKALKNDE